MACAWSAPSHYLNQCWNIVIWTNGNKLRWNLNRNLYIFIQEMHLKMLSGKWRSVGLGLNVLINQRHLLEILNIYTTKKRKDSARFLWDVLHKFNHPVMAILTHITLAWRRRCYHMSVALYTCHFDVIKTLLWTYAFPEQSQTQGAVMFYELTWVNCNDICENVFEKICNQKIQKTCLTL